MNDQITSWASEVAELPGVDRDVLLAVAKRLQRGRASLGAESLARECKRPVETVKATLAALRKSGVLETKHVIRQPRGIPSSAESPLTVADILAAKTGATRYEDTVRTVGPALVLVIELEAPVRLMEMCADADDFARLAEFVRSSPFASELVDTYFEHRGEQGEHQTDRREHEHSARLDSRQSEGAGLRFGEDA